MNSNLNGPLAPQHLLQRLLQTDFREAECHDISLRLQQQREVLLQLIQQYEEQISKAHLLASEEQQLLEVRSRLMAELEALRGERATIDARISEELATIRPVPSQQPCLGIGLTEARTHNSKLKIRIKDLLLYIERLQVQNRSLEEERRVLQTVDLQYRQKGENWRAKIEALQREHISYETELRGRMRAKEEEAIQSVRAQQIGIYERNRRRMESLSALRINTPVAGLHSRRLRQI